MATKAESRKTTSTAATKKSTDKPAARTKAAAETAVAKRAAAPKKKINRGQSLICETCGLAVTVDEIGDLVDVQEIICCDKPMKPRTSRAKAVKK
jgi:hypothetical protein